MALADDISTNLQRVRMRIARACDATGRDPNTIQIVAVSKAHSEQHIRAGYDAGLRVFGENYAQELAHKADALRDLPDLRWRFIGHLQRNKLKLVERASAAIDTVDSLRLARAISGRAEQRGYHADVLAQVNVGGEPQKSGCTPDELSSLIEGMRDLPSFSLRGLMTVAPHFEDPEDARATFAALRALAEQHGLPELSMGMSHDLEPAILEGATMVRLGTAIFGPRP